MVPMDGIIVFSKGGFCHIRYLQDGYKDGILGGVRYNYLISMKTGTV